MDLRLRQVADKPAFFRTHPEGVWITSGWAVVRPERIVCGAGWLVYCSSGNKSYRLIDLRKRLSAHLLQTSMRGVPVQCTSRGGSLRPPVLVFASLRNLERRKE